MDPETAKKLFESGANVILLNVPPGTEIGIDMQSWRTGPEFKGIKMIPSGLHFIYFRFVHVFTTLVLFLLHSFCFISIAWRRQHMIKIKNILLIIGFSLGC